MSKMIIIEGCDNSGKSTLANYLSKKLYLPVIHSVNPRSSGEVLAWCEYILDLPVSALFDRFSIISEAIYGPGLRGVNLLGKNYSTLLQTLISRRPYVIYCRPPLSRILKFSTRQLSGVKEHAEELVTRYDEFFHRDFPISYVHYYNFEVQKPDQILLQVTKYLEEK